MDVPFAVETPNTAFALLFEMLEAGAQPSGAFLREEYTFSRESLYFSKNLECSGGFISFEI